MSFEDDLRRVEEHLAEARRLVQRQKGLIVGLRAAGAIHWMPREYFGCWSRTFDDLSNTETASEQTCSSKDDRDSSCKEARVVVPIRHVLETSGRQLSVAHLG